MMSSDEYKELDCVDCQQHDVHNPEFRNCLLFGHGDADSGYEFTSNYSPEIVNHCPISVVGMMDRFIVETIGLYFECIRYGVLPRAGGIYDQDDLTMRLWSVITNALDFVETTDTKIRELKGKKP